MRKHATWPVVLAACILPVIGVGGVAMLQTASGHRPSAQWYDVPGPRD